MSTKHRKCVSIPELWRRQELWRDWLDRMFSQDQGYLRLGHILRSLELPGGSSFHQSFVKYPNDLQGVIKLFSDWLMENLEIYFCPHLFSEPTGTAEYALPGRAVWADLDDCQPSKLGKYGEPYPSIIVHSSYSHSQAYWLLTRPVVPEVLSQMNRRIYSAYKDEGCDSCWSLTHLMRVPGTFNHKNALDPYDIECEPRLPSKWVHKSLVMLDKNLPVVSDSIEKSEQIDYNDLGFLKSLENMSLFEKLIWGQVPLEGQRSEQVFTLVRLLKKKLGFGDGLIVQSLLEHPVLIDKWDNENRRQQDIERCILKLRSGG